MKILFSILEISILDQFFFFQAISLSISSIFIVNFEVVFQNFIPKIEDFNSRILLFEAIFITSLFYALISLIKPILILLLPYSILPLFLSFLYAKKLYTLSNAVNIFSILLFIFALIVFKPNSLEKLLYIYFFTYLPFVIISLFITKPKASFKKLILNEIWSYFKISFISALTSPIYRYLDRFILGFLGSTGDVSAFTLIKKTDNTIRQILNAPLSIATVEISSNEIYFYKFFPKYTILVLLFFFLELLAGYFILLYIGGKSFIAFYPNVIVFSFAFLISAFFTIYIIKQRVRNNPSPFLIYNISFVILYFVFAIILFNYFKSLSISISFLISTVLSGLLAIYIKKL
ncbi:MAG: hypothetical protein N2504_01020 [candidate division WOR-3 bacterium]|nr:hypothetical protein [candidate division WOR-3 bacterium]MCX7947156.1 hypothetical protein [candidate division WOR-3 bacterium]MDW8150212.1 hypothetical protein [candidate division WOR-3 bacterium]